MRFLTLICFCLAIPAFAQDNQSLGKLSVAAVLDQYTINPLVQLPDTHKPLPPTGKWSIRTTRPDTCPHDDSPCARVVYTVPEAHASCEWTVVPGQGATPAAFLDQNEDASRYLLRKLQAVDLGPLIIKSPQPVYPPIARAAHVPGSVVVRLIVSGKGTVTSATPLSGQAMLLGASADAAKKWTFHPLQVGTQPTPFTVDLSATFKLKEDPSNCDKDNFCKGLPDGAVTMHP